MSIIQQKKISHPDQSAIDGEFSNIYNEINRMFVHMAGRAPTSSDPGLIWIYKNGSTLAMYLRDWTTGTWRGPTNFT